MSLPTSFNSALVAGTLSSPPRKRQLPSGSVLLNLEVRVDHADRAADSVPVSVFDPAATVAKLAEGDPVVVVGSIRRRFFRAGGATVSRTEVVADKVVRANRRAAVDRLAAAAVAAIAAAPG
ncbi:MAG TPA: single-stranded DNA-binding protein [Acidimicrobiales bacterium]|nr:single-stranded DNA-binding protein [Acidimicrobiales bacterium]